MAMTSSQKHMFGIMSTITACNVLIYLYFRLATVGPCGYFPGTMNADFEVEKYKGSWYELKRDVNNFFETGECITAEYGDKGKYVSVKNT